MPVKVHIDLSDFKIYMSDVGMLTMQLQPDIAREAVVRDLPICYLSYFMFLLNKGLS